jgi:UDP-N-acetylglucosamine 2-epimerase (non-hydrolysing)
MAPVVLALKADAQVDCRVCVTGQHREMLDQVMHFFDITPDYDLDIMQPGQDLFDLTSQIILRMRPVLEDVRPDFVLVHGDTTTTLSVALAAFYHRIAVGHVEAGLRTRDIYSPWPEEINRRVAGLVATCHFTPTERSRQNLLNEATPDEAIIVTGNTIIDAMLTARDKIEQDPALQSTLDRKLPNACPQKKIILVTGHRRENFGAGVENICRAIKLLASRGDVEIVYPVHLNPNIREPVSRILKDVDGVHLIEPLEYATFIRLLSKSYLVITDSGGVQEEAPSFGIPVLVMRDTTERPEAVEKGVAKLVGAKSKSIFKEAEILLDDGRSYAAMAKATNPYGDGKASARIAEAIRGM